MALIVNEKIIVLDKDGEPTILYNGEATYPINYNNLIQEYVTESKKYYETLDSPVDVDFSIAEKSKARFGVQAARPRS